MVMQWQSLWKGRPAMALALAMALAGCAKPEARGPLPFEEAPPFSGGNDAELVADRWWTAFDDPALNQQMGSALSGNLTLLAAWERLRAADAVVDRAAADRWPDLDGVFEVEAEDGTEDIDREQWQLGLVASYELDLWGRIDATVDAERLRAAATAADYQTAALSLTAEVAETWYELAEARLQLQLVREQIEVNRLVLELLETRFGAGQIRSADVLRQRQLVHATEEQALIVQTRLEVLEHRFALLLGRPPQGDQPPTSDSLPALPPPPATGLPADLLQRRPDVIRAHRLLLAADRDLAAAVSDQYPRITIGASLTTAAESPERLFEQWLLSLTGQVVAPLFDAGQRRAEVRRTEAITRQRIAEYGQTVLDAFAEVENALARERLQRQRIDNLGRQLDLADRTYEQLRLQYLNGVTDYLAVLDALTEQQRLQRDLLSARLDAVQFRIALYRALAGGLTPTEPDRLAAASQEVTTDE